MAIDPEIYRHKEWLGFLQPVGLVVSPPALVKAQAVVNRNVVELQQRLLEVLQDLPLPITDRAWVFDFRAFAVEVLEWDTDDLVSERDRLADLEVVLPDYGETLAPSYAVPNPDGGWMMLVQSISPGTDLDAVDGDVGAGKWAASPQAKFERLLRETGVAIGILFNGTDIRLVYAPRGESSGHLTFPVQAMCEVSGRLILGAIEMLLSSYCLFTAPDGRRLGDLLAESRKYQAEVSTALANQVVDALWELLRGFQMADAAVEGRLLQELAAIDPQHIYGGLITTLMRLVFLLYAEDEGLMPADDLYQRNYAVSGLFDRLRTDAGNYPDTMDQRYGAWAWLLSLFRLVYDGGGQTPEYLPARHGQLFNPDEYPFLEGRVRSSRFTKGEQIEPPRIPDGVVYRMLDKLLILQGERLSYRSLDVEQIGSVYEGIMGFAIERAAGASIAVRPQNVVVNLENLLAAKGGDRAKLLKEWAACEVSGKALADLKQAKTAIDLVTALGRKVSPRTPNLLPVGSLYLQPGEERRRSGSHYTPRSLTEPIVRTTLCPIWERLGDRTALRRDTQRQDDRPSAAQILSLKVCDLAMGSGAFLVEACRQLASHLVEAWNREGLPADLPEGEEPLLYARRLVAQRCLYGVDKNPFAVNLAKLALWLVTLAKDQPFTFLDHALKCGDSLVGLSRAEIGAFGKDPIAHLPLMQLEQQVDRAQRQREQIQSLDTRTEAEESAKRQQLAEAEQQLAQVRLTADVAIAAFFDSVGLSKRDRAALQEDYALRVRQWQQNDQSESITEIVDRLRQREKAIAPFNWEIEFPEVFGRENPGFDAIVGNPPFLGGWSISGTLSPEYLAFLCEKYPESGGQADLVAYFFRKAFDVLRENGTCGLVATNTIAQGDTRKAGLSWICSNGGTIYQAQKRMKWVGAAAVVVSVINLIKGNYHLSRLLNDKKVDLITAFLFHAGSHKNPEKLLPNEGKSFKGTMVYGMGFTFDDTNPDATSIAQMHKLIKEDPRNQERIFPYIGGEEVNSSPTHSHHRYVINFGEMSEAEARNYPGLIAIVEEKVKPARLKQNREIRARYWWRFGETTPALFRAIEKCDRVLVCSLHSEYLSFAFLSANSVFSHALAVFATESFTNFGLLQSRIHEIWSRFFGSSLETRFRYTPSDCFETFPFPENWESDRALESIGKQYYEFRAELMVRNNQGLTETYNRFHDPNETDPDILQLRQLHEECDRAVLAAYGWSDIAPQCEFLLDYEDEEPEDSGKPKQKKKPWRYRWNEETHDEVLARLLDLNQKRYEQEILGGASAQKSGKPKKGKTRKTDSDTLSIFDR